MSKAPIVAIDGPVGVGKSSVAKQLAQRLGYLYIDTGAMYRAVTLKAMRSGLDLTEQESVGTLAGNTDIRLVDKEGALHVYCDGNEVTDDIRTPEVSANVSPVADNVIVRECLVRQQQKLGAQGGVVMEGRDIGTVVFPNAGIKIYLDADPKIRAQRRYEQLIEQGKDVSQEETLQSLLERDKRDRERPVGALKLTDTSIVVDTTGLSQPQVIDELYKIVTGHPSYSSHAS